MWLLMAFILIHQQVKRGVFPRPPCDVIVEDTVMWSVGRCVDGDSFTCSALQKTLDCGLNASRIIIKDVGMAGHRKFDASSYETPPSLLLARHARGRRSFT